MPTTASPSRGEENSSSITWGACGASATVNSHWALILLPPRIVDYIIVHELAHFMESNHTPGFWLLVERTMQDFEQRREWLGRHGGQLVAL